MKMTKKNIEKALFVITNLFFASILPSVFVCGIAAVLFCTNETVLNSLSQVAAESTTDPDGATAVIFGFGLMIFLSVAVFLLFLKLFLFPIIYSVFKKSYFHEVLDKFVDKPSKFLLGAILTDFVVNSPILIMYIINDKMTFVEAFIMFCVLMAFTGGVFPCWLTFLIWRKIVMLVKGKA